MEEWCVFEFKLTKQQNAADHSAVRLICVLFARLVCNYWHGRQRESTTSKSSSMSRCVLYVGYIRTAETSIHIAARARSAKHRGKMWRIWAVDRVLQRAHGWCTERTCGRKRADSRAYRGRYFVGNKNMENQKNKKTNITYIWKHGLNVDASDCDCARRQYATSMPCNAMPCVYYMRHRARGFGWIQ